MLKNRITPSHLTHSLVALAAMTFTAQLQAQSLEEVKVLGGRLEQQQFDTPGSVQVIDEATIRGSGIQVNLSDTLGRVPGVVALNRNNYAQDVQISIRGFGARAPFGLRGIRLITDGIPATIPDGQGQSSTASLTSAARIEVLTGPLAQLYGNSSGGVIQTFTREAGDKPEVSAQLYGGSYGMYRADTAVSGRTGDVGIVADYSVFHTDGYRANSSADRKQLNSVITWDVKEGTRAKFIVNLFDMPLAQDPAGLNQADFDLNPKKGGYNTVETKARKIVTQSQIGTVLDHTIDRELRLTARAYTGNRTNVGYQTSSRWVGLDRDFSGAGIQMKGQQELKGETSLDWVFGFDYDLSKEHRTGGNENALFEKLAGSITRDEVNKATNSDFFAQANWTFLPAWTATAGVRVSNVELSSVDSYLTGGDGSGSVKYSATSPVIGLTWHTNDQLNIYTNVGKGFETPTLSEVAYATNTAGNSLIETFNKNLKASTSLHKEIGAKLKLASSLNISGAIFNIETENEIVNKYTDPANKTAYQNASKTNRNGLEFALAQKFDEHWKTQLTGTWMQVKYAERFRSSPTNPYVESGNYLPAVPQTQVFANISWYENGRDSKPSTFVPGAEVSLDVVYRTKIFANDLNTFSAPANTIANLRVSEKFKVQGLNLTAYGAIDNLADTKAIGSVIVNASSDRYFEPALPRNYTLGVQASLPF
jgi:iron complex outermembrane receptor protein